MAPVKKFKGKASRKWNWDTQETIALLDAYADETQNLIRGCSKGRRNIWKRITSHLYPNDSSNRRTLIEVRKKWQNLCSALRNESSKISKKNSGDTVKDLLPPVLAKVSEIVSLEQSFKKELVASEEEPDAMPPKRRKRNIKEASEEEPDTSSSNSSESTNSAPESQTASAKSKTVVPVTPSINDTPESILPSIILPNCILKTGMKELPSVPFIKEEPVSPPPEREPKKVEIVATKPKSVPIVKSSHQIFTFNAPTLTNTTTSGPSPLRIISIVNPLSSTSAQTTGSKSPPKIIFKPINSFPSLSKPSTSNMVVVGSTKMPIKKVSQGPSQSHPLFHHLKKPEELKTVDTETLKTEAEKLGLVQERLQIEKEKLQIEKDKLNIEKEKLRLAKAAFQQERSSKREVLEEKKLILENKKLKAEIGKITLEKDLLTNQLNQSKN